MTKLTTLSDSLEITLKEGELQNVTFDLAETIGDTFLNEGILKDIPIIGTIVGLTKSTLNIRDQLFLKKLIYFMSELSNVSKEDRFEQINKIESSESYKEKVGEKLLYIIEKCEDHEKAKLVGKLFNSYLKGKITYSEFLRCSNSIQNLFISDIRYFLNYSQETIQIDIASQYIFVGLMKIVFTPPKMVDRSSVYFKPSGTKVELSPGSTIGKITELGKALKRALNAE